jgi:hypothetical protein
MNRCWHENPKKRPSFKHLLGELSEPQALLQRAPHRDHVREW